MTSKLVKRRISIAALAVAASLAAPLTADAAKFSAPTYSSPITMSADGKLIWVVNPGGDQVVVIGAKSKGGGAKQVVNRIQVSQAAKDKAAAAPPPDRR